MSFFNMDDPRYQKAVQRKRSSDPFVAVFNSMKIDEDFAASDAKMRLESKKAGTEDRARSSELDIKQQRVDISKEGLKLKGKELDLRGRKLDFDNFLKNRDISLDIDTADQENKYSQYANLIGLADVGTSTYFGSQSLKYDTERSNRILDLVRKRRI
ncbi:hypothetical protein H8E88_31945 [candidate division KSB1 bacterium]|nr:hypothetical protein [candidate division KSB1 bacterium]